MTAKRRRVKPIWNCASLETPGVKGCEAAASQISWRGVADIDILR